MALVEEAAKHKSSAMSLIAEREKEIRAISEGSLSLRKVGMKRKRMNCMKKEILFLISRVTHPSQRKRRRRHGSVS